MSISNHNYSYPITRAKYAQIPRGKAYLMRRCPLFQIRLEFFFSKKQIIRPSFSSTLLFLVSYCSYISIIVLVALVLLIIDQPSFLVNTLMELWLCPGSSLIFMWMFNNQLFARIWLVRCYIYFEYFIHLKQISFLFYPVQVLLLFILGNLISNN